MFGWDRTAERLAFDIMLIKSICPAKFALQTFIVQAIALTKMFTQLHENEDSKDDKDLISRLAVLVQAIQSWRKDFLDFFSQNTPPSQVIRFLKFSLLRWL